MFERQATCLLRGCVGILSDISVIGIVSHVGYLVRVVGLCRLTLSRGQVVWVL